MMYFDPKIVGKAGSAFVTYCIDIGIWESSPIERNLSTVKMNDEWLQLAHVQWESYRLLMLVFDIIIVSVVNTPEHLRKYLTDSRIKNPVFDNQSPHSLLFQRLPLCSVCPGSMGILRDTLQQVHNLFFHAVNHPRFAILGKSLTLPLV